MIEEANKELEINEENFSEYFKDIRNSKFSKGDVIAQYTSLAEFIAGDEKKHIISLVANTDNKMEATAQVMRKLLHSSELDAYKVPRMIAEDLLLGMSEEDYLNKPYKYTLEMFFYTKSEYVPKDDPHWSVISVIDLEKLTTEAYNDIKIESKICLEEKVN